MVNGVAQKGPLASVPTSETDVPVRLDHAEEPVETDQIRQDGPAGAPRAQQNSPFLDRGLKPLLRPAPSRPLGTELAQLANTLARYPVGALRQYLVSVSVLEGSVAVSSLGVRRDLSGGEAADYTEDSLPSSSR
ncbi:MAG: hypothetical protein AAF658_09100, partial [Myxococcota bacterium]